MELCGCYHASDKRHRADQQAQHNGDEHIEADVAATPRREAAAEADVFCGGDKGGGPTAEAVQHADHLGHLRHLDLEGKVHSEERTNDETRNDVAEVQNFLIRKRDNDCQQHADGSNEVPSAGCFRRAQHLQPDNEEDCGKKIGELCKHIHRFVSLPIVIKSSSMGPS